MSSILTNNGAMVALQTLNSINSNLAKTQSVIATGKDVATAKDNSSVWAISKVMESDVAGFKAISDSLSLGEATLAVASKAAESVNDLLIKVKEKVVAAQEENVDRGTIQKDIDALTDQIESVVGAAQFNGLNLIDGSSADDVNILSSLDRKSDGSVKASHIAVERQDLSLSNTASGATFGGSAVTDTSIIDNGGTAAGTAASLATGATQTISVASVADGNSYRLVLDDSAGENSLGQRTFEYVASDTDSATSVAATLENQVSAFLSATGESNYTVERDGDDIKITNNSGSALSIQADSATGGTAGTTVGGLGNLASIDVTSDAGATSALTAVEGLIQAATDAAASFGSVRGRMETQSEFISNLTDSLTSGIGTLVDADMEEASAKLQALQVQQQLGVQSLSIANQAPQSILSLFR